MLKIKVNKSGYFLNTECIICGEVFELGSIIATLWDNEVSLGDVCRRCLCKRKDEFSIKLSGHINKLTEKVDFLKDLIKQLEAPDVEFLFEVQDAECLLWPEVEKKLIET